MHQIDKCQLDIYLLGYLSQIIYEQLIEKLLRWLPFKSQTDSAVDR